VSRTFLGRIGTRGPDYGFALLPPINFRSSAEVRDEARRIAANIAKLTGLAAAAFKHSGYNEVEDTCRHPLAIDHLPMYCRERDTWRSNTFRAWRSGVGHMFAPNPKTPFLETLLLSAVVVGSAVLAAVVLYGATGWLWLVVHEGLH
jgi:hypothetical protein